MKEVQEAMYLGKVILNTVSMNPTIQSRKLKGIGIISQIMSLLNSVSLGRFYVQRVPWIFPEKPWTRKGPSMEDPWAANGISMAR